MTGLIVAGFHRSGTSSVAQMLDSYGMSLGDDLMEGNEFNRFGHFESWPVVRFHDTVLERVGANWSKLLDEPIVFSEDERRWVLDYVAQKDGQEQDWALKDPRMCRFMRQWKELAPDLKFLIVYRNPADCCQSLIRRSNLLMARSGDTDNIARRFYYEPDLALRLWLEHNRELVELQRIYPDDCVVLGHHHILAGYDFMPVLETRFGISAPKVPDKTTIDPAALSEKRLGLFCSSDSLMAEVLETWRDLEQNDIALTEGRTAYDVASTLLHDPEGRQACAWMAEIQVPELHKKLKEQRAILEEQKILAKGVRSLVGKVSKPPFSFYFMNKKKYREVIKRVLSQ